MILRLATPRGEGMAIEAEKRKHLRRRLWGEGYAQTRQDYYGSEGNIGMDQPGLHGRHRDKNGELSNKHGNTLVRTLRKIYGQHFAEGCGPEEKLSDVLISWTSLRCRRSYTITSMEK